MKYLLLLLTLLMPALASAREPGTRSCADTVKECFVSSHEDRSKCFLEASKGPSCTHTPLGDLTARRWAMLPSEPTGTEVAPSSTGPQLVDKLCVENFDNEWSSVLLQGPLTGEMLQKLNAKLASCVQVEQKNLLRP